MASSPAVVVTGAARGIGRACVLLLAQAGYRVFAGVRSLADGDALQHLDPPHIHPLLLDVTDTDQIAAAVGHVTTALGDDLLAGIVNNAGISVPAPLEFIPLAAFREQLEVNVTGQLAVTQAFLPLLRQSRGRIVMMSSVGAHQIGPYLGAYHAAKFALDGMLQVLRLELAPFGVSVITIEPSLIATPMWETAVQTSVDLERQMPTQVQTWYGRGMAAARTQAGHVARGGRDARTVAQVVVRALRDQRPKERYTVG